MKHYILKDEKIIEVSLLKWAKWFETSKHIDFYNNGDIKVSTVFLGIDHSFGKNNNKPILFETMIFGGVHDQYQERYSTIEAAKKGHAKAVKMAKEASNE